MIIHERYMWEMWCKTVSRLILFFLITWVTICVSYDLTGISSAIDCCNGEVIIQSALGMRVSYKRMEEQLGHLPHWDTLTSWSVLVSCDLGQLHLNQSWLFGVWLKQAGVSIFISQWTLVSTTIFSIHCWTPACFNQQAVPNSQDWLRWSCPRYTADRATVPYLVSVPPALFFREVDLRSNG